MKPVFKEPRGYEDLGDCTMSLISFCGDALDAELTLLDHSIELETGESSILANLKEDYKRSVPLVQLAFLPDPSLPQIFVDNNHLTFINMLDLLQGDQKTGVLDPVNLEAKRTTPSKHIFSRISLFNHPEDYWFKRILIYHKGRLISHFKQPKARLCGII